MSLNYPRILAENADVAEQVLERIRVEGPLSASDFERKSGPTTDWFGAPTNAVRAVLEAYTFTGVLGLARRDGNRRYYDLLERLLPADVLERKIPLNEQLRHKLLSRYRAHGLLGASGGGDIFGGLGPAKPDPRWPGYPGRSALREELVEDGEIVAVEVEGVRGKRFVLREEVDLLAEPPEPPASVAFLSPFDPLIWDRASARVPLRVRLRVGPLLPAGEAALRLVRACRSSSATASSGASSRGSTARAAAWRCWASGGRKASSRDAPTASSTRCAPRCGHISASRARAASTGRRTSGREKRLFLARP